MFGFINLHKPQGFTSHDCVAKLRRLLNTRKIGHGGTLDPSATGVLPVAVGKATRLLQFLPEAKAYRAIVRLGTVTTTGDLEGEILHQVDEVSLALEQITECLPSFVGRIEQVPPIYSAIKKDGQKLYELARKGQEVDIEPRLVDIYAIELLDWRQTPFMELELMISCGPGTYIRAIARDLGDKLGVGGTLAGLSRTKSCGMELANSLSFAEIESQLQSNVFNLIAPSRVLSHLTSCTLSRECARRWCQGQLIDYEEAIDCRPKIVEFAPDYYLVTYDQEQQFLGISILFARQNILKLKPKIVCSH